MAQVVSLRHFCYTRRQMKLTSRLASLAIVLSSVTVSVSAQNKQEQSQSLDSRIRAEVAPFKGKVFLYAKNLDTGQAYSFNGDERVRTASTIKIAVMIEAFARVADGRAKWTDELVLTKAARYGGSGILPELSDGLRLTLQDAVRLMMVLSDNTATNMVLDYLTTDAVNVRMNTLGFKATRIMRRVGGGGESKEGKLGDNLKLEKLERGEVVSKEASKQMLDLMQREQGRNSIGRNMPGVTMASKYGALDALRSCVAILYTKQGRIAIAITVDEMPEVVWSVDNPAYLLMMRLSSILAEELKSKGVSSNNSKLRRLQSAKFL
jgi:beta-lactamase class A